MRPYHLKARTLAGMIAMSAAGFSAIAAAQEAPASETTVTTIQPSENEEPESGIQDIVVTAQFRAENLQDIPAAISSVDGKALVASGVNDLTGLSASVPGLYLSSYSTLSPQLYIRGVGSNDDGITAEGAVGVYIDGVYAGRASSALFDLYDIDRVEVLRGPQGTLYGRNTNGGAIKIETTKPGPQFRAGLELGLGSFGQRTVRGLVSGPVTDGVYAKLSGSMKTRGGWSRDETTGRKLNDEDSVSLRGQVRFEPNNTLNGTVGVDYTRDRSSSSFKEVVAGSVFGLYNESTDRFRGRYDLPDAFIKRDIIGVSGQFNWDFGAAVLSSSTGYRKTDIAYSEDYDSTPFPIVHVNTQQHAKQFSQELRLVSGEGKKGFSYIIGGFFLSDRGSSEDEYLLPYFGLPDELTSARTRTRSAALFGEGSYRFSDKLKITAGLRYSDETKRLAVRRRYRLADGSQLDFVPQSTNSVGFSNLSPRVIVEFSPNDDVLTYFSITKGFKSGGYNNFPGDSAAAATAFRPEKITAYELGGKATLFDRRLRFNAALFQYAYSDLQVFAPIDTGGSLPIIQITNAARARIKGAEIEATLAPASTLSFNLTYAHLFSRYQEFAFGPADLSGNRLPRAPQNTLTMAAEWSPYLTAKAKLKVRGEYVYSSNLYFTAFNDPDLSTGKIGLFNASIRLESDDGRWSANLYGRNLGNKTYLAHGIDALATAFDLKTAQIAAPRQIGLTLGWRY